MTLEELHGQLWAAYDNGAKFVEILKDGIVIGTPAYVAPKGMPHADMSLLRYDRGRPENDSPSLAGTRELHRLASLLGRLEDRIRQSPQLKSRPVAVGPYVGPDMTVKCVTYDIDSEAVVYIEVDC